MEFVVDRSGSVSGEPFKLELGFVGDIVQAFGNNIGPGKTQYVNKSRQFLSIVYNCLTI